MPSKCTFDDPSARQNLEPFLVITTPDHFDGPVALAVQRFPEFTSGVAAIGEDMTQERIELADGLQGGDRAISVLNGGTVNDQSNQKAVGVGHNMSFPALHLLACVIPANAPTFSGFDALAVSHTGTGYGSLPSNSRAICTSAKFISASVPSSRQG